MVEAATEERIRAYLRDQFKGVTNAEKDGWVLMENAGSAMLPRAVVDAVVNHYETKNVQVGSPYPMSAEVSKTMAAAKAFVGDFMGCDPALISIGISARALLTALAGSLFDAVVSGPRQQVTLIVASHNHSSNVTPWVTLHNRLKHCRIDSRLVFLTEVDKASPGFFSMAELETVLDDAPPGFTLVALPHVSNTIGEVIDVKKATALCKAKGARCLVDGVAYASSAQVQAGALGADWYVVSLYKVMCPQSAAMYAAKDAWGLVADRTDFEHSAGATNFTVYSGILGFREYLRFVNTLMSGVKPGAERSDAEVVKVGMRSIGRLSNALGGRIRRFLKASTDARLVASDGPPDGEHTKPIVSFVPLHKTPAEVTSQLAAKGIACRHGDLSCPRLMTLLGFSNGAVRLSPAHYNTPEEMDKVICALELALLPQPRL